MGRSIGGQYEYRDSIILDISKQNKNKRSENGELGQWDGEARLRLAEGRNNNRPSRERRGVIRRRQQTRRNSNNHINLDINQHQSTNRTARMEEGGDSINYRTAHKEIPRVARATNRPQVYPQGSWTNDLAQDQRWEVRWRLQLTAIATKNKRLFKEGSDQLLSELTPTYSQIVEGMNKNRLTNTRWQ